MKKKLILLVFIFGFYFPFAQTKIISTGEVWEYYDGEAAPPENWMIATDNIKWKKGKSPLGYGDEGIETIVSYGDDVENKHITKYFKKTFRLEDNYEFLVYELKIRRDDGIVIYINGKEFLRDNMPDGVIDHNTRASGLILSKSEDKVITKLLHADDLHPGYNTISASVHQARPTSSDCFFNLELLGNNNTEMIPGLLKENNIKNLMMDIRLKDIHHKQEIENKNIQFNLLQQSKNRIESLFIIICIILFIGILGLLFFLKNLYSKLKISRNHIVELKDTNASKDREMMGLSLSSLNNQQFLKELKKEMETSAKNSTDSIKKELRQMVKQIDYNISHEDDWENLKKHFNAIHSGFFDKLVKLHPSLTEVEIRHCIFIKLHMQTKEIAKILNIEPRSVQVSRYRIKKKMNLDENEDLRQYLFSI